MSTLFGDVGFNGFGDGRQRCHGRVVEAVDAGEDVLTPLVAGGHGLLDTEQMGWVGPGSRHLGSIPFRLEGEPADEVDQPFPGDAGVGRDRAGESGQQVSFNQYSRVASPLRVGVLQVPVVRSGPRVAMFVNNFPGLGGGPPAHHDTYDEAFYVLTGEMEFCVDGHTARVPAGSMAFVARGATHAFRNPFPIRRECWWRQPPRPST